MAQANITQPSFSSGIISTELFSRIDFSKLSSGLKQCENFVIRPAGGAIYRVGTKFIAEAKLGNKNINLIPFIYNRKDGLCLEFGDKYIRFYKNEELVKKDDVPYEVTTTYAEGDVSDIKYTQNKNKMYLVHPKYPPAILERKTDTEWTLRNLVFNPSVVQVASVTIKADAADNSKEVVNFDGWQYAVAVVNKDGLEGLPIYSNVITSDIDLLNQPIVVSFSRPKNHDDIKQFNIYRIKGGEFFHCYTIKYEDKKDFSFKDLSFALDETKCPKESFDEFKKGNYPTTVGYWNQRLILGNTQEKPSTFWGSRVGEPEDFSSTLIQAADEGFELTFNSGTLDAITDFVPMDDLIVFTEGKIWRVAGTSAGSMAAYIESYTGSSGIRPFATRKSILYIDSSLNTVSNFVYSYELNGYSGQNLDILARDLMDGYVIRGISYRDTPYGVMYAVRSDGVLLGLTYLREENIYAWHMHTTKDGFFRNICSVDQDENDLVYCAVERYGKKYIECFQPYINNVQDINDSWHLDCATRVISNWKEYKKEETTTKTTTYKAYDTNSVSKRWYCWRRSQRVSFTQNHYLWQEENVFIYSETPSLDLDRVWINSGYSVTNDVKTLFSTSVSVNSKQKYSRYEAGDFIETINPSFNRIYITEFVSGVNFYIKSGDVFEVAGAISSYSGNEILVNGFTYSYNSSEDEQVTNSEIETIIRYTEGEPTVNGNAYGSTDKNTIYTITQVTDDTITVDGDVLTLVDNGIDGVKEISGLDRFNGQKVTIMADMSVYEGFDVSNGVLVLPVLANNVLVGLPYEGTIETIPNEIKFSSGNSTVGIDRKINDGVLAYYRSRGLWYGKNENKMYEIKPYTQANFGENIPLESGKLRLKVADGFNFESSFVVKQKSPFPALVQSITLGSSYGDKI